MWEHSVESAVNLFSDAPGVKVVPHHDTASFIFDDTVLVRFKKASIQLHTSNVPTFLSSLFHRHESDLFGYEGLHRVELAHVWNRFETGLDWIGVVARERDRVLWHFELDAGGAVIEGLPQPKPLLPAGDRVVRPIAPPTEETRDQERE